MSKRIYTTSLSNARLTTVGGAVETLSFAKGLTVLSGGNGAGKSTVLGALWRCVSGLDPEPGDYVPGMPPWLQEIEVIGECQKTSWNAHLNSAEESRSTEYSGNIFYVDPAAETLEILRKFKIDGQPGDLIEGLDPSPFSHKQLEVLSFILRREYSEFSVYEITDFSEDDTPIPYFLASSMGKRYYLDQMGRGELAAAYLLWRLASVPQGSIVLIEEPESHLAMFSQDYLVDAIVAAVVDQDLCIVVSSHSPGFFQRLPPGHVALISSLPVPRISSGLTSREVTRHLGVQDSAIKAILLVEDRAAAEFLRALLEVSDGDALRQVEIKVVSSGESGIRRIVPEIQSDSAIVRVLGLLDGDQRTSTTESGIGFLIGNQAPEVVLQGATFKWRSGEYCDWHPTLDGGTSSFKMILERFDGRDPHDWLHGLVSELGGLTSVMRMLVNLLLKDEFMVEQCVNLAQWIRINGRLID